MLKYTMRMINVVYALAHWADVLNTRNVCLISRIKRRSGLFDKPCFDFACAAIDTCFVFAGDDYLLPGWENCAQNGGQNASKYKRAVFITCL